MPFHWQAAYTRGLFFGAGRQRLYPLLHEALQVEQLLTTHSDTFGFLQIPPDCFAILHGALQMIQLPF